MVGGLRIDGNPADPQIKGEGEAFLHLGHRVVVRVGAVVGGTLHNRKITETILIIILSMVL